jgi:tape measure domain-containing protein
VATLSNLIVRIGASTDDFDKKVNASLNKIKRFSSDVAQAGQSLAIGFSAPLIAAGAASLSAAADIEKLEKGLSATMKSTAAASKEFEKLKDLAKLPGLGLEEAVKGSIRLQSLGTSATDARRIMGELGNALSIVGGTRADFGEVIRQLSQLGATGKVTKENLDPIIERIPQLSAIIKEKFGAAALGDPAKTFEKLGISSQEFIKIMVDELAKGERAGNTFSNSLQNLKDAASQTAAEFGKSLLVVGQRLIDEFFSPGLEKAKALAKEFNGLSDSTKMLTIELLAVAAAIPIAIVVLGTMAEKTIALAQVAMKLWSVLGLIVGVMGTFGARIGLAVLAMNGIQAGTTAAAVAVGVFTAGVLAAAAAIGTLVYHYYQWQAAEDNLNNSNKVFSDATEKLLIQLRGKSDAIIDLEKRYRSGTIGLDEFNKKLIEIQRQLHAQGPAAAAAAASNKALTGAAAQDAIMAAAGIKDSYQDILKEITGLREAEKSLLALGKAGENVSQNLALVRKEIGEKLKQAAAGAKPAIDEVANAFERLGVVNSSDFIGKFIALRSAFEKVKQAFAEGKVSSVDLQRSTESVNAGFSELRAGLGAVPFAVEKVAASFDFARERAMLAMGDISTAFNAARNLSLSQVIVPGGQANNPVLDEAQNRAAGKRGIEITRENIKDSLSEYQKAQAKIRQAVSTITTDFSRGIADIILNGGKIAALFEKLGKQIANTLIRTVIELGINQVVKSLAGLLVSLGGVAAKVGVAFGGQAAAVGASAASTAAASAAASAAAAKAAATAGGKVAATAASASSSSLGSAAAAANPITAMVTAVASVVTAISSVVANFQFAAMNKSLDLIEKETRYSQIHLLHLLEKNNEYLPKLKDIFDSLIRMELRGGGFGSGNNVQITINTTGDTRQMLDALTRELKLLGVVPA